MPKDKKEYNKRYYSQTREYQLAKQKMRYENDPEFKAKCKDRDNKRYRYRASWGGLIHIDPYLFLK